MNEYFSNLRLKRKRLPTEEQDTFDKMSTDYCRGERAQEGIKDILDEIKYYGEIGGHRL